MKYYLGSSSFYRKEIFSKLGVDFEIVPADIDEKNIRDDDPARLVEKIAEAKSDRLVSILPNDGILVTADTIVYVNNCIREKGVDENEARMFIADMGNHETLVYTGVCVVSLKTGKKMTGHDVAVLKFEPFSESEISEILKDPMTMRVCGALVIENAIFEAHAGEFEKRDTIQGLPLQIVKNFINSLL